MLAGAVHTVKRLLVEYNLEMMLFCNLLHDNHQHHVLVYGLGGLTVHRSTLKLVRSHLIVPCLEQNTELVCLCLKILHECADLGGNGTEIMVFKLLVLGGSMADDCPVAEHKVRPCIVQRLVYKEIFLL